jgi:hypothetical protein
VSVSVAVGRPWHLRSGQREAVGAEWSGTFLDPRPAASHLRRDAHVDQAVARDTADRFRYPDIRVEPDKLGLFAKAAERAAAQLRRRWLFGSEYPGDIGDRQGRAQQQGLTFPRVQPRRGQVPQLRW